MELVRLIKWLASFIPAAVALVTSFTKYSPVAPGLEVQVGVAAALLAAVAGAVAIGSSDALRRRGKHVGLHTVVLGLMSIVAGVAAKEATDRLPYAILWQEIVITVAWAITCALAAASIAFAFSLLPAKPADP